MPKHLLLMWTLPHVSAQLATGKIAEQTEGAFFWATTQAALRPDLMSQSTPDNLNRVPSPRPFLSRD
ncbi:hypothetical protein shim_21930 [Shimia sp. SK013]|uniref:hypothetical protein n=1 Tax=Shimia sp. SK013 TaxID=1389006 RepID=UPI0006B48FC8|nr:hypothetical protein [Shimia sp. SK013]KPA21488.1 hypothetical protein shim_21930 [Shimia sp. SK013]